MTSARAYLEGRPSMGDRVVRGEPALGTRHRTGYPLGVAGHGSPGTGHGTCGHGSGPCPELVAPVSLGPDFGTTHNTTDIIWPSRPTGAQ